MEPTRRSASRRERASLSRVTRLVETIDGSRFAAALAGHGYDLAYDSGCRPAGHGRACVS
jgi:hypothetical protein